MLLQNVTAFRLTVDQLAHSAVLGPSLVLRQKSNHLHFFFCVSITTISSLCLRCFWEKKKSPVENKTFHYWQKQLTKSVHSSDDVILLWLHWGRVSTRTRDSDPVTSEKMSQFTSSVLFTFADYTVARWAAKTTWLISLPEVIHIKDGHMPTE